MRVTNTPGFVLRPEAYRPAEATALFTDGTAAATVEECRVAVNAAQSAALVWTSNSCGGATSTQY